MWYCSKESSEITAGCRMKFITAASTNLYSLTKLTTFNLLKTIRLWSVTNGGILKSHYFQKVHKISWPFWWGWKLSGNSNEAMSIADISDIYTTATELYVREGINLKNFNKPQVLKKQPKTVSSILMPRLSITIKRSICDMFQHARL